MWSVSRDEAPTAVCSHRAPLTSPHTLTDVPCGRLRSTFACLPSLPEWWHVVHAICILLVFPYVSWELFHLVHKELHLFLRAFRLFPVLSSSVSNQSLNPGSPKPFHTMAHTEVSAPRGLQPPAPAPRPAGSLSWHPWTVLGYTGCDLLT